MPRITELSSMEAGQKQKRFLMNHFHESEPRSLFDYIELQRSEAEQRIDKLFCMLITNSCGDISAKWFAWADIYHVLKDYDLIDVHSSSGLPIVSKKVLSTSQVG